MREYNYRVNTRGEDGGRKFWFHFGSGRVTYGDLNTSLALMKRSKLATGQSFPRPSQARVAQHHYPQTYLLPWSPALLTLTVSLSSHTSSLHGQSTPR